MLTKNSKQSGSSEAAWWAVLIASSAAILYMLFLFSPGPDSDLDGNPYPTIFRQIMDGRSGSQDWTRMAIVTTVSVVLTAQLVSILIGLVIGGLGLIPTRPTKFLATVYVEAIRGVPLYVMLLFVYFALSRIVEESLPVRWGIRIGPFASAVFALGICYGAYMAEVVRSGIESIPHEEVEAGSLEAGTLVVYWYIILPQALRKILPAIANECIALLKDSAIIGVITLNDITRSTQVYAGSTFRFFEAYAMLGLIYLVLSLLLSRVQRWLERLN